MSFFESQSDKKYCEECRETLISPGEVWRIEMKAPGSGGLGLLSKAQSFVLCKKCFLINVNNLENTIIKRGRKSL